VLGSELITNWNY